MEPSKPPPGSERPAGEAGRAILRASTPLGELSDDVLDQMLACMHVRNWPKGEALMRQGERGDCLVVISRGSARIDLRRSDGRCDTIAQIGRGAVIGELSLLTDEPRSVDVVAETPIEALVLDVEDFHKLARRHLELGTTLTQLVADRLGQGRLDLLGGKQLQGYRIRRPVGSGAMAIVYEATELAGDRRVALKMMSHRMVYQPGAMKRFESEAAIVQSLEHDHIARLFGTFSAYGTRFQVMEFCAGPNLKQLLQRFGPFGDGVTRRIIGQLGAALAYIHARGVLHRDLKPTNVMLDERATVKLMDFGLAKPAFNPDEDTMTNPDELLGTPVYMAPELFGGIRPHPGSDIYALACVAYQLLTGRPPFRTRHIADVVRQKNEFLLPDAATLAGGVGQDLHALIRDGLSVDPAARPTSLDPVVAWAAPLDPALAEPR